MFATQTKETTPEIKGTKQWIKENLALSLKTLQMRYVTTDSVVTSEDGYANLLCCALEAVFIHGLKNKYVHSETGGSRKGGPLPRPVFWKLLKTVTHRDVITELESLSFVGTEVGRCRAWLRLALNDSLVECYLTSLFREYSKLQAHYQPVALLLDPEDREVLLSYLQGLSSLTFNLSYKSAVLNEWTTTPLSLAGLCSASQTEVFDVSLAGEVKLSKGKKSMVTVSQCFGGSDTVEQQLGACEALVGRGNWGLPGSGNALNLSNMSLETAQSSQPSSSMSLESLVQGQDPRSPAGEQWSCDLHISNLDIGTKRLLKDVHGDFRESGHSSQLEDYFVSILAPDLLSETTVFSLSDSEAKDRTTAITEHQDPATTSLIPDQEETFRTCSDAHFETFSDVASRLCEPAEGAILTLNPVCTETPRREVKGEWILENPVMTTSNLLENTSLRPSANLPNQMISSDSISHHQSWISDDDIFKPNLEDVLELDRLFDLVPAQVSGLASTSPKPNIPQSPPSVVHRRQTGLSNPFRGLLKLGHLERRGAIGMWRYYYCELSPFEFRLYINAEDRICCDTCSLLRCEEAYITTPEGHFELAFSGKRLHLRAANCDEAEDWLDCIVEAVNKCRPAPLLDNQWVVMQASTSINNARTEEPTFLPVSSALSVSSSPKRGEEAVFQQAVVENQFPLTTKLDWSRPIEPESDAVKEAVLYYSVDTESFTWVPLIFSLTLEALKGFQLHEGRKVLHSTHSIEGIRDVVPDVSLGGPAFFKVLTTREILKLRAETPEEARSWRTLIREAVDSYLESGTDSNLKEAGVTHDVCSNINRELQHRLKGDSDLLVYLGCVPSENGLDTQSFKCAGCPKHIGISLGRVRLCEFSGQYYCDSCHQGDTSIIPSRMVHNWDLTPREISRKAFKLLAQIDQEPLLRIDHLNPDLCNHAESMAVAKNLRQRLRLLGDYLLTCSSGVCKNVQARIDQRTYLLESSHLYSVQDLRQIAEGHYETFLNTLILFASNHVHNCDLCTQRGFICQICHSNDIIFPFQFDKTTRCKQCKAVFHSLCKDQSPSCPRCLRLQRYLERDFQDQL